MKKLIAILTILSVMIPMQLFADSYEKLWKQVESLQGRDLPESTMEVLAKIVAKAEKEKKYGHLLKAQLMNAALMVDVAPDSLAPAMRMLQRQAADAETQHPALAAVYYSVLAEIVANHRRYAAAADEGDDTGDSFGSSKDYYRKSMSHPELLAKHKAADFKPMIEQGGDSRIFAGDLLHVLGYRAADYQTMHDYYDRSGNRPAALLTALDMARQSEYRNASSMAKGKPYVDELDSLISRYGDLVQCGEVAIARYDFMRSCYDVDAGDEVAYIDEALARWGSWKRMNELRNRREELIQPGFDVSTPRSVIATGKPIELEASSVRNIKSLTMRIQQVNLHGDHQLTISKNLGQIRQAAIAGTLQRQTKTFELKEWELAKDTFRLEPLPRGIYLLEFVADNSDVKPQQELLYVSDLYVIVEELPRQQLRVAVVDATSGQPVPYAQVYMKSDANYKKEFRDTTVRCDEKGEAVVPYEERWRYANFYPFTADDTSFRMQHIYASSFEYGHQRNIQQNIQLFTDRSIYRPGQTVHVSLIDYRVTDYWTAKATGGATVRLTLRNANYQVVGEQEVTTNQYGVASADFTLPADGLTGNFSISTDRSGGSATFHVEEYKRPTFQLDFKPVEGAYKEGDTVRVTGVAKSFAGVPVQGAKVKYKVVRREAWWCWWLRSLRKDVEMASGETTTDDDGCYLVDVPLVLPEWEENSEVSRDEFYRMSRFYDFVVEAKVTDLGGESHTGTTSVPFGSRPKAFNFSVPRLSERQKMPEVTFSLLNASGQELEGEVRYTIDGQDEKVVAANIPINIYARELAPGQHVLKATCEGMEQEQTFVLFDADDPKPCHATDDWFYQTADVFPHDGSPVSVMVGSSAPDVHIFYNIFSGDSILESGTIDRDRLLDIREFSYREEYGSGLRLTYAWVKDGNCYTHSATISRPMPEKQLNIKWTTFRDRLTPGQHEEWTLQVTQPDGNPATAQMMAAMYDKSLDEIYPHGWHFSLPLRQWLPYARWNGAFLPGLWVSSSKRLHPLSSGALEFTTFSDDFSSLFYDHGRVYRYPAALGAVGSRRMMMKSNMMVVEESAMEDVAPGFADADNDGGMAPQEEEPRQQEEPMGDVQVRENLSETAFFYPSLLTDKSGQVRLKFTLPESLTTWKFLGLANDADMNYGMVSAIAVAQKDVMVQPNMPRFVRVGDDATITTRLINTSDRDISGRVAIQLYNPDDDKMVWQEIQPFDVAAGKTTNAAFSYQPTGDYPLLVCKIIASGEGFSDGEQHYLPILPNSELVTNTIPFTQNNPGTVSFNVERLFGKNATQQRLTIEYTNNPAWLMVQALPFVGDINERNAISLTAAYYANCIGRFILEQSPKAKTVFESWKNEKGNETSLMSALEKNQELKNIILAETPWVMDATREREQKQALANFFDENAINYRIDHSLELLAKLQRSDGSFAWWEGMEGSPSMTGEVMEYLNRLNMMLGEQQPTRALLGRATTYLSNFVLKEVDEMKRRERAGKTAYIWSSHAIQWIYMNGISGRKLSQQEKDAEDYLLGKLKKEVRQQSMYSKAKMAVALYKRGDLRLAADYAKSLKEYTVYNEEMGRYFDTYRAAYSWCNYNIPTQVAAIEALSLITPDDRQTVEEMKRWLLQEKRTQGWDTPISSVNAVFAFLNGESNILESQEQTKLRLDGKLVEAPRATAGLGYVKTAVDGKGVKTFTAEKTSTGTSWGALYGQAFQPTSDIETADTSGLKVKRQLLVEGKVVPATHIFHVGDRVTVRLTIEAERDFDYVQLMDKRAACMEPIQQLSGYHWGYYIAPKDNSTNYYFSMMAKGTHIVENEYYIDRTGRYETGTCTVQCAYSPEYSARAKSVTLVVE